MTLTRLKSLTETAAGLALAAVIYCSLGVMAPFAVVWEAWRARRVAGGTAHQSERLRARGWAPRPSVYSGGKVHPLREKFTP